MTQRERMLLFVLIGAIVLVGGFFLVIKWFRDPLQEAENRARTEQGKFQQLSGKWNQIVDGKKDLNQWRLTGLSSDTDKAIAQYSKFLQHSLLEPSGLKYSKAEAPAAVSKRNPRDSKKPSHTALAYAITAKGKLENLTKFMRDFYRTALPHQIKSLRVDKTLRGESKKDPELSINMGIEVLVVHDDKQRGDLPRLVDVASLVGRANRPISIAPWEFTQSEPYVFKKTNPLHDATHLAQLAKLNVFQGYMPPKPQPKPPIRIVKKKRPPPPPPQPKPGFDMRPYMRLISIHVSEKDHNGFPGTYATYRNLMKPIGSDEAYTNIAVRKGYDIMQIMDEKEIEMQLHGQVLLVDHRDVFVHQWADEYAKTLLASTVGLSHSPVPFSPLATASALIPGRTTVYRFHIGENFNLGMEQPVYFGELWEEGIIQKMAEAAAKWSGPSMNEVSKAGAE